MTDRKLVEKYLGKAAEAEYVASRFQSKSLKMKWLAVAQGYKMLASAEQSMLRFPKNPLP